MLDVGKSVTDLWRAAGGIIANAEKTRKVDAQPAALGRDAPETSAGPGPVGAQPQSEQR